MHSRHTEIKRRRLVQMAGISTASIVGFSGQTLGQEDDANVTIEVPDQLSDGETILIESFETDIDGIFQIFQDTDERPVYKSMEIEAGTEFTNQELELDAPIPESQSIRTSLYPIGGGRSYDTMSSEVSISETVDGAQPVGTPYGTEPGVQKIEPDPDAGFHSPYFLYTPSVTFNEGSISKSQNRPLLVQTYVWGDFDERVDGARQRAEAEWIASGMNCPLLVAPLPFDTVSRFGLQEGIEFTDPRRERADLQLLAMIEDAKSRLEGNSYTIAEQIHFSGGSSAGVFIDTFAALHPEEVKVFSSGANGATFLPIGELTDDIPTHGETNRKTVTWPFGTADFETRVGKAFNKDAWMDINQFRWIGAEDQDPENTDTYIHKTWKDDDLSDLVRDIFGRYQVDHRFETSRAIYDHLDVPAEFTTFERAGHVPESHHRDKIAEFHRQQIAEHYELVHLVPQEIPSEIQAGETATVSVLADNLTAVRATTSVTLTSDGTETDAAEITVDPNSTETVELEATFEDSDEYTLSINGGQFESSLTVVEADSESTEGNTQSTDNSEAGGEEVTDDDQPGLGIVQTVAALGGISYLLKQRLYNTE